ncbi:TonB-dependent receptor plug domain-containing protein [Ectothiorhodospira variabilis]|uniref:TonB-dependent receptor plug domain-containing protein n=1 Tax=Ectothiorhodospira variabilis TaxID=505694 RepID=UPI001EFB3400|nr:TonB-dependent receptor [Ectothiorhodospira variabilis]MCG5498175.1 TonB-dependent receptor [Ectothiorhodospira variabilis]
MPHFLASHRDRRFSIFFRKNRLTPLAGAMAVLLPTFAHAQASQPVPEASAVSLETVTVTAGTRTERALERSPASVEVITAADIQNSGSVLLGDVLRNHSGLYVSADGTLASIRGASRDDTVFLINGRRISGEPSRRYELNRLTAGQIERIEILKGPGSVLYGSDALGGVINIITRQPRTGFEADVDVQAGMRDGGGAERFSASANLLGGNERTQVSVLANASTRNAYESSTSAQVGVTGQRTPPSEHGGASSPVRNIQDIYRFDEQRLDEADVYNLGVTLRHEISPTLQGELELGWMEESRSRDYVNEGRTDTNYTNNQGQTIPAFNIPTRWTDDNRRTDVSGTLDWRPDERFGLRYNLYQSRYEKERSVTAIPWGDLGFDNRGQTDAGGRDTILTETINDLLATWSPAAEHTLAAGAQYRDGDDRWHGGAFLQHEWQASERLDLVYGARYDEASVGEDSTTIKAGGVYALTEASRLRFNYAQGFKVPENRDYDSNHINPRGMPMLGAHVSDPSVGKTPHDLKPERSETWELGLLGRIGGGRYELTAFHTDIRDRVERVREQPLGTEYITFRNVGEARIRGLEGLLTLPVTRTVHADFTGTWVDAENRNTGKTLSSSPDITAVAGLNWAPDDRQFWQVRVRHVGQRYLDADNTERDSSYTVADLTASFQPRHWDNLELYGGIDNLFDASNDSSLLADPGRFYRVGLRYSLR